MILISLAKANQQRAAAPCYKVQTSFLWLLTAHPRAINSSMTFYGSCTENCNRNGWLVCVLQLFKYWNLYQKQLADWLVFVLKFFKFIWRTTKVWWNASKDIYAWLRKYYVPIYACISTSHVNVPLMHGLTFFCTCLMDNFALACGIFVS